MGMHCGQGQNGEADISEEGMLQCVLIHKNGLDYCGIFISNVYCQSKYYMINRRMQLGTGVTGLRKELKNYFQSSLISDSDLEASLH